MDFENSLTNYIVFSIELNLPSGKTLRVAELNNEDYLTILKFCHNSDFKGLNDFFEQLYLSPDMDIFDRFFVLLYVRKLFVGSKLSFVGKDEVDISYSIDNILEKLLDNYTNVERVLSQDGITVKVDIPVGSYFRSIDDLYNYTIREVEYNGNTIDFTSISNEEKSQVLDRLPTSIFLLVQEYLAELSESLFDLTVIEENKDFEISEINISLLGNGIIYFISSIFKLDLLYFYETLYNYNQFISNGSGDFFKLTFNEIKLLLKVHAERIQKENEEIEKKERLMG